MLEFGPIAPPPLPKTRRYFAVVPVGMEDVATDELKGVSRCGSGFLI